MLKMKKIGFNLTISLLTISSLNAMDTQQNDTPLSSSRISYPKVLKTPMVPLHVIKEEINKNKANIEAYASNLYARHTQHEEEPFSAKDNYTYHFEWNQFDITICFKGSGIMKFFPHIDDFKEGVNKFLKKDDISIKRLSLIKRNKEGKFTGGEYISITYDYTPLEYLFGVELNIPNEYENCTIGVKEHRQSVNEYVIDTWFKHRDPAAPLVQCELSSEGLNKTTLKGLSLDKIIADFRAGKTTIEALQSIPQELQIKLPPDILEKLPKLESHSKDIK